MPHESIWLPFSDVFPSGWTDQIDGATQDALDHAAWSVSIARDLGVDFDSYKSSIQQERYYQTSMSAGESSNAGGSYFFSLDWSGGANPYSNGWSNVGGTQPRIDGRWLTEAERMAIESGKAQVTQTAGGYRVDIPARIGTYGGTVFNEDGSVSHSPAAPRPIPAQSFWVPFAKGSAEADAFLKFAGRVLNGTHSPAASSGTGNGPGVDLNFIRPSDPLYNTAIQTDLNGMFTVFGHGDPEAGIAAGNGFLRPQQLADQIRRAGWDGKEPILLVACSAGSGDPRARTGGFAQELSRLLGVEVIAPNTLARAPQVSLGQKFTISTFEDGRAVTGFYRYNQSGQIGHNPAFRSFTVDPRNGTAWTNDPLGINNYLPKPRVTDP
jgi:hypothetical protein